MADFVTNLQTSFSTLSKREQRLVAIGGLSAMVLLIFIVSFTFSNKAAAIRSASVAKSSTVEELLTLASTYSQAREQQKQLEDTLAHSDVKLISFMEEKAKASGLELPTINPRPDSTLEGTKIIEASVEVTLIDVKLNRLVEFLTSLEAGPGIVKVKYMRLEPHVTAENLTAVITIATYRTKG